MNATDEAMQLQETMGTPGWAHVLALFAEHISTPKDELFEIMSSRPETLTGKAAFLRAGKARGCSELLEAINGKLQILLPQTSKRGGA